MKHLIKNIIKETLDDKFLKSVVDTIKKSDPPYYRRLNDIGFDDTEIKEILTTIFGTTDIIFGPDTLYVFEKNVYGSHNLLYQEPLTPNSSSNYWSLSKYGRGNKLLKRKTGVIW